MMVPGKTPKDIVNRLNEEVVKALANAEVKERFATLGADAWTMRPDQFDAYIRDEIKSNAVLVKAAGLSPAP
jgi:tripartite-type tricarboxylate transporter receptor subunit TctC